MFGVKADLVFTSIACCDLSSALSQRLPRLGERKVFVRDRPSAPLLSCKVHNRAWRSVRADKLHSAALFVLKHMQALQVHKRVGRMSNNK